MTSLTGSVTGTSRLYSNDPSPALADKCKKAWRSLHGSLLQNDPIRERASEKDEGKHRKVEVSLGHVGSSRPIKFTTSFTLDS